jgi:adenosylmethionine-8-amino-7-oxononanoate aminotransferase
VCSSDLLIYSQNFLKRLANWCQDHDVHLIADEIMTGFGRTGKPLACHHANIIPDFICLGKNLSGGFLPMSAVLTSQKIYDVFYDDYESGKSFLHSHTFSGNALAAAVALEHFKIMQQEDFFQRQWADHPLHQNMQRIAEETKQLNHVRGIGAIAAADLINPEMKPRFGYHVFQKALDLGAWLRPLGNTLYWLPPLNIANDTLNDLMKITQLAVVATSFRYPPIL